MKKAIINKISTVGNFLKLLVFFALELLIIGGAITLDFPAEVKLLVSNVLSIILAFIFYRSIAKVMTEAAKGEISRNLHEESLNARIAKLESEKRDLEQKLESADQTRRFFNEIEFGVKIELLEEKSSGYVVKEEHFDSIKRNTYLASKIPTNLRNIGNRVFGGFEENRSMLFIDKVYRKHSIGINLQDIEYAIDPSSGNIYLCGMDITILHDTSADLESYHHPTDDISHCWVISTKQNGEDATIKTANTYDALERAYRATQLQTISESVTRDIKAKCLQYTRGIQNNLIQRYPNLRFISADERDNYKLTWCPIRHGNCDPTVMRLITDMVFGLQFLKASNDAAEEASVNLLDC